MRMLLLFVAITWHVASSHYAVRGPPERSFMDYVKARINLFSNHFTGVSRGAEFRNFVCSPIMAWTLLSEAALGARSKTRRELNKVLPLPISDDQANAITRSIIRNFTHYSLDQRGVESYMVNKMFIADRLDPKPEFADALGLTFGSNPWSIDLANIFGTRRIINGWSGAASNGHMMAIIEPGEIHPDADLVLVSSVYFKGEWASPFSRKHTETAKFWSKGYTLISAPTMFKFGTFRCGDLPQVESRFIELPYRRLPQSKWTTSMFIILPDRRNGINALVSNLERVTVEALRGGRWENVNLYLPKFEIHTTLDLKKSSIELGIVEMFGSSPDFGGITDHRVKVVQAIQKVSIVADEGENDVEATSTLIDDVFGESSLYRPSIEFRVDHPFVCMIVGNDGLIHITAIVPGSE